MKWVIAAVVIIAVLALGYYFIYVKKSPSADTNTQNTVTIAADTITMQNMAFEPSTLTIKVGDTVTFTNNDAVIHAPIGEGGIDGGELAPGESYKQVFDTAGTFNYHCSIHPEMTGTIIVQ